MSNQTIDKRITEVENKVNQCDERGYHQVQFDLPPTGYQNYIRQCSDCYEIFDSLKEKYRPLKTFRRM